MGVPVVHLITDRRVHPDPAARLRQALAPLGPAGQTVAYERIGSAPFGDTILDAYRLSYEGIAQPAVIYVDEYVFETLYAPVGFTCSIAFPLVAP